MSIGNSNFGFSGGGGSTPPPATTEWLLDGNTVGSQKYFGTNDNYSIPIYTNGVARGIFTSSGNFGFGMVLPTARVHIQGSDSTLFNYGLKIDNSSSSPMLYVANNGYIGMGIAIPTARLDIVGIGNTSSTSSLNIQNSSLSPLLYVGDDGGIGFGTSTPASSSILDLTSTTKGLLTPRMTTGQRDLISSPSVGLFIYNTSTSFFNYWDGSTWIQVDSSTGGDVSGSGTTNYAVMWTDGGNSVIGNSTWYYSTNDYLPVTTGSNIGDATHRIGTIFMASVFDYSNSLTWVNSASTKMTLSTAGNLGIGVTSSSSIRVNIQSDATSSNYAFQALNSASSNIALFRNDGIINFGNASQTNQRLVRIGQGTSIIDLGSYSSDSTLATIYMNASTPSTTNYAVLGTSTSTNFNAPTTQLNLRIADSNRVSINLTQTNFSSGVASSGALDVFNFTTPASTNQTLSTETIGVRFNMSASIQHATGAITTQRDFVIDSRTHTFVGASTITDAATLYITGEPIAGTNATITNAMSLWIPSGNVNIGTAARTGQRLLRIGQDTAIVDIGSRVASTAQGAIYLSQTTPSNTNYNIAGDSTFSIINSPLAVANTNAVYISHASTLNYTFFPNRISFTPTATVSGATDVFNFTTPASTNQTLSTETIGVRFNMSATIQHATGALTTQRDFVIDARTHSFVGASTITTAATLAISAAPIAGTNATITNGYALWLQSGSMLISSGILSVVAPSASNTGAYVFTSSTAVAGANSQNPSGMALVHSGAGFGSTIYYGIGVQNRSLSALSAGMGVGILMGLGYGGGSFVNTRITSYAIGTVSSSLDSAFGIQTSIGGTAAERFTFYKESFGINTTTPNSYLQINGSFSTAYVQKTAAYVITSSDFTIECTSGTFDITLPTAVGITGRIYVIANSGAGTITLATTSSQTIDGNASGVLTLTQNKSYTVQSNNSNWVIIAVK